MDQWPGKMSLFSPLATRNPQLATGRVSFLRHVS